METQLALYPLPGDGRFYCGPAAIASFTGLHPKEEIRASINAVRDRNRTQGVVLMKVEEVVAVLKMLGFEAVSFTIPASERPMLKDFAAKYPDFCGVVNVTGHFIALSNGIAQDNLSGHPYPISKFDGQRKRVKRYIRVWKA